MLYRRITFQISFFLIDALDTTNYIAPVGVRIIVINPSVCLSVCVRLCVGAIRSLEPLDRSSRNCVYRSDLDDVAVRYVLPVLWMTSRLTVMGGMASGGWPDLLLAVGCVRDRGWVWCLWMLVAFCFKQNDATINCLSSFFVFCSTFSARCE